MSSAGALDFRHQVTVEEVDEDEDSEVEDQEEEHDPQESGFMVWLEDLWYDIEDSALYGHLARFGKGVKKQVSWIVSIAGRYFWIIGTSFLVTAFPLLIEIEREQQSRDVEAAQLEFLKKSGYSGEQIAQLGIGSMQLP